jgi:hypothetical protein
MRLIDTQSLQVTEFSGVWSARVYVILSHRWGPEEVTLQDMEKFPRPASLTARQGYKKIEDFCRIARERGFRYGWVDTCCIDKTSSTELSEAINSMFEWYERSIACYVHLLDAETRDDILQSEWFTRGWTLQELIAPKRLIFFSSSWVPIGTKASLGKEIEEKHGVPNGAFSINDHEMWSTSQILSWAAKRRTTRVEDRAYSLLGLLRINMPLIYGEGMKALIRLQQEVIKKSADQSIFAWTGQSIFGYFADNLRNFEHCSNIVAEESTEFQITNRGLRIELPLVPTGYGSFDGILACRHKTTNDRIKIPLIRTKSGRFHRYLSHDNMYYPASKQIPTPEVIYITEPRRGHPDKGHYQDHYWGIDDIHHIQVDFVPLLHAGFQLEDYATWDSQPSYLYGSPIVWGFKSNSLCELPVPKLGVYAGLLFTHPQNSIRLLVMTGAENNKHWLHIDELTDEDESLAAVIKSYYCARRLPDGYSQEDFDKEITVDQRRSQQVSEGKDVSIATINNGTVVVGRLEPRDIDERIKMFINLSVDTTKNH